VCYFVCKAETVREAELAVHLAPVYPADPYVARPYPPEDRP
jgi:hypothetical protein